MLHLDPTKRMKATEAIQHPWLADADTVEFDPYIILQPDHEDDDDFDDDNLDDDEESSSYEDDLGDLVAEHSQVLEDSEQDE